MIERGELAVRGRGAFGPAPASACAGRGPWGPRLRRGVLALAIWFAGLAVTAPPLAQTPPGTVIPNTASISFQRVPGLTETGSSNLVNVTTVPAAAPALVSLFRMSLAGGTAATLPATSCQATGGGAVQAPAALLVDGTSLKAGQAVGLTASQLFHGGEAVYIEVKAPDQNLNASQIDTITVTVTAGITNDQETVTLAETGPNTGIFAGYLPTRAAAASPGDCVLEVARDSTFAVRFVDVSAPGNPVTAQAAIDPIGRAFDSRSGQPVNGVRIRLVDSASGAPAQVLGDDGRSVYPADVTSGATVTDSGGTLYQFPPGSYRFPLVMRPGNYKLIVTPPAGYAFPSMVPPASLQALPGAPFNLAGGSFGAAFAIAAPVAATSDLPVDHQGGPLVLTKLASSASANVGDFVQFIVSLTNTGGQSTLGLTISDTLPAGLRYVPGSTKLLSGASNIPGVPSTGTTIALADPVRDATGLNLKFTLPPLAAGAAVQLHYVVQVVPGAARGEAVNVATATAPGGLVSNTAQAGVFLSEDLFRTRGFIVGRLTDAPCGAPADVEATGIGRVRVYLEDGRYAITDKDGRYHFEDVPAGTHVVALDPLTVPSGYVPVACAGIASESGRASSRMIELSAGALWRADFHLHEAEAPKGHAKLTADVGQSGIRFSASADGLLLQNLRLLVMLPEGAVVESLEVAGKPLTAAPAEGVLSVALKDLNPGESREISLRLVGAGALKATLLFDGPCEHNVKTGVLALEQPGHYETAGETPGLRAPLAAETPDEDTNDAAADLDVLEHLPAVESLLPGRAMVLPSAGFAPAIPALHVAIQHGLHETVALSLDGAPVSELNRDQALYNSNRTVAVSRWRGVPLREGDNHFLAVVKDADGEEVARLERTVHYGGTAVRAVLDVEKSRLVADGRTRPLIVVRLLDRFGQTARPGTQGSFRVEPPYRSWWEVKSLTQNPLVAVGAREPTWKVSRDGYARLELEPTSQAGTAVVRLKLGEKREQEFRLWLEPVARDWILVGVAEGTSAYNALTSNAQPLPSGTPDDGYSENGRVAFFAKGQVQGGYLMTLAYDSGKDNQIEQTRVNGFIDPNKYYTLYGDGSESRAEAPSQKKIYVKIERKEFALLFGDFATGFTVTELARYARTLTGAKLDAGNASSATPWHATAFAARTAQMLGRDFLPADGTSGPYRLSGQNIIAGSDQVTVEVHDRFRTEVIVSSTALQRYLDYDIDYQRGYIFLTRPLASRDQNLNPEYLNVEYETMGDGLEHTVAGARGTVALAGGRVELGATAIDQGSSTGDHRLGGVDLKAQLDDTTRLRAEYARSNSEDPTVPGDGTAYLVELSHVDTSREGRIYAREQQAGFGLGEQAVLEQGTKKVGAEGRVKLDANWSVRGQAYQEDVLLLDNRRQLAEAELRYDQGPRGVGVGLRSADDVNQGLDENSRQAFVNANYDLSSRLALKATAEHAIDGASANPDYPDRLRAGLEYKLAPGYVLFADHEHDTGTELATDLTRVGIKTQPWAGGQLESAIGTSASENGLRIFSTEGITQGYKASDRWAFDVGYERTATLRGQDVQPLNPAVPLASASIDNGEDFSSGFLGALYKADDWTGSTRIERREGDDDRRSVLALGLYQERRAGHAFAFGLRMVDETGTIGDSRTADGRLSWAYRPGDSRWIVLDRLDLVQDDEGILSSARVVNNLHLNLKLDAMTQLGLQYGARDARAVFDGIAYRGYTDLYGVDYRRDLDDRWDVGVHGCAYNAWAAGVHQYCAGLDAGRRIGKDLWISVGYNLIGFNDRDFSTERAIARGIFIRFRAQLSTEGFKDLVEDLKAMR
jgi:uncharacterized repeat protein (TIGR01451 family)